jgi:hypothetical protein
MIKTTPGSAAWRGYLCIVTAASAAWLSGGCSVQKPPESETSKARRALAPPPGSPPIVGVNVVYSDSQNGSEGSVALNAPNSLFPNGVLMTSYIADNEPAPNVGIWFSDNASSGTLTGITAHSTNGTAPPWARTGYAPVTTLDPSVVSIGSILLSGGSYLTTPLRFAVTALARNLSPTGEDVIVAVTDNDGLSWRADTLTTTAASRADGIDHPWSTVDPATGDVITGWISNVEDLPAGVFWISSARTQSSITTPPTIAAPVAVPPPIVSGSAVPIDGPVSMVAALGPLPGVTTLHLFWSDVLGSAGTCAAGVHAVGLWHSTATLPITTTSAWSHELIETDPYFKRCAVNASSPPPGVLAAAYSIAPKPQTAVASNGVLYVAIPHSLDATSNRMRVELYTKPPLPLGSPWSLLKTFSTSADHQQWRPTLAVQRIGSETAIAVGWLDTSNASGDGGTTSAVGSLSTDGGATWSALALSHDSVGAAVSWKFKCATREYNQSVAVPTTAAAYPNGAYLMTWVDERTPPSGGNCDTGPSVLIYGAVVQPGSP